MAIFLSFSDDARPLRQSKLTSDYCLSWNRGRNNVGQLGLGDTVDRGDTPESITNLTAVELGSDDVIDETDLGAFHTCSLLQDGSIKVRVLTDIAYRLGVGGGRSLDVMPYLPMS